MTVCEAAQSGLVTACCSGNQSVEVNIWGRAARIVCLNLERVICDLGNGGDTWSSVVGWARVCGVGVQSRPFVDESCGCAEYCKDHRAFGV